MITREMYDNGLRCKSINCNGCNEKVDCVQYIEGGFEFPQQPYKTPMPQVKPPKSDLDTITTEDNKLRYPYFVSYSHVDRFGRGGNGMIEIFCDRPVETFDDVMEFITTIKKGNSNLDNIIILNYIPLKEIK